MKRFIFSLSFFLYLSLFQPFLSLSLITFHSFFPLSLSLFSIFLSLSLSISLSPYLFPFKYILSLFNDLSFLSLTLHIMSLFFSLFFLSLPLCLFASYCFKYNEFSELIRISLTRLSNFKID